MISQDIRCGMLSTGVRAKLSRLVFRVRIGKSAKGGGIMIREVVAEGVGQVRVRTRELSQPGAGEAEVRLRRVGVCGTDIHSVRGEQPFFTFPRVLGHELGGRVETIGPGVEGISPGMRVAVLPYLECGRCRACRQGRTNCCTRLEVLGVHRDGGMTERLIVPSDHLVPVGDISDEAAAIVEPLAIGAHAIERSGIGPNDRAVVVGAGPIGLGVMALLATRGVRVAAVDVNAGRLRVAREWGRAEIAIRAENDAEVLAWAGPDGPEWLFDATGNVGSMTRTIALAGVGGTVVLVGIVNDSVMFSDAELHRRELTLKASRNATRTDFETVVRALGDGHVGPEGYVTHRFQLEEIGERWPIFEDPGAGVVKAMVVLD